MKKSTVKKPNLFLIFVNFSAIALLIGCFLCLIYYFFLDIKWREDLEGYNFIEKSVIEVLTQEDWSKDKKEKTFKYYASTYPYCMGRDIEIYVDDELVARSGDALLLYKTEDFLDINENIYICDDDNVISKLMNSECGEHINECEFGNVFTGTIVESLTSNRKDASPNCNYGIVTDSSNGTFAIDFNREGDGVIIQYLPEKDNHDGEGFVTEYEVTGLVKSDSSEVRYKILYSENEYMRSVFDNTGLAFVVIYGVVFILCVVIAFVISLIVYYKRKSNYEAVTYRTNLTNTLAHSLKTPLMAISSYAENYQYSSDAERKEYYVSRICENVFFMNGLINKTLDIAKSDKVELHIEDVNVKEIIEEIVSSLGDMIKSKELHINTDKLIDRSIKTDKLKFKNALICIVENAVKYALDKSEIIVSSGEGIVFISNEYEGSKLDMNNLVEPFVRGDGSKDDLSGYGLGLFIAKRELETLDMTLELKSECNIFTARIK